MFQEEERLFCFHLLAQRSGYFVSGNDRLGAYDEIKKISQEMIAKAVSSGNLVEKIFLQIEVLEHFNLMTAVLPDFIKIPVGDFREGRRIAEKFLIDIGVSQISVDNSFQILTKTYGKGGVCPPGAIIIDSFTGERLDGVKNGIWVGRVDLTEKVRNEIEKNLGKNYSHIIDWLVLSAKILMMPGMVAELTISNDKNTHCGLISTPDTGVVYFPQMRANENEVGGRIIFVRRNGFELEKVSQFLENAVFLIDKIGKIR